MNHCTWVGCFAIFGAHHLTYGILLVKKIKKSKKYKNSWFLSKKINDLIIWLNQFNLIISNPDGRRTNVVLNGKLVEEVECFKYLGPHVSVNGGIEGEVKFRMNEVGKVCGGMKTVIFFTKCVLTSWCNSHLNTMFSGRKSYLNFVTFLLLWNNVHLMNIYHIWTCKETIATFWEVFCKYMLIGCKVVIEFASRTRKNWTKKFCRSTVLKRWYLGKSYSLQTVIM